MNILIREEPDFGLRDICYFFLDQPFFFYLRAVAGYTLTRKLPLLDRASSGHAHVRIARSNDLQQAGNSFLKPSQELPGFIVLTCLLYSGLMAY